MPKTKGSKKEPEAKKVSQPSVPEGNTRDQPPKQLPQQSQNALLMKLSTEVRFMIFEYIVLRNKNIRICTPSTKKHRGYPSFAFRTTCNLRLVNKQIYSEVNSLFYTYNCIVIGNGSWRTVGCVNLDALQRFVACVPAPHLAQIREMRLEFGITKILGSTNEEEFTPQGNDNDLMTLARTVTRRFTGVTKLELCIPRIAEYSEASSPYIRRKVVVQGFWFARTEERYTFLRRLTTEKKWPSFINLLLKLERLEYIDAGIFKQEFQKSLQQSVENSQAAGRVTVLHSWKLKKHFVL